MNKRGLFALSILILSLNFISAYGGGLGDLLDNIGTENIVLVASFIISFAFIFYVLGKFFKNNNTIPGVIALAAALLITQGVNKFDIGFKTRIYLNLSDDLFNTVLGAIVIIALIALIIYWFVRLKKTKEMYTGVKKRFSLFKFLMFLTGLGLILLGLLGNIYNSIVLIVTGVVLILLSFFIHGKKEYVDEDSTLEPIKQKRSGLSIIFLIIGLGLLVLGFFLGNIYLIIGGIVLIVLFFILPKKTETGDPNKPTKVVYVDWYPQKGLFVHKKGLIGRTESRTREGIERELRRLYPNYNIILQFRQKEAKRPLPEEIDRRRQRRTEQAYVRQQTQDTQRMQRKRSLNELKRYYKYLKFKRNQNIPKAEGESSEAYQIRNKNRKKKIDKIIKNLDKRIREMS